MSPEVVSELRNIRERLEGIEASNGRLEQRLGTMETTLNELLEVVTAPTSKATAASPTKPALPPRLPIEVQIFNVIQTSGNRGVFAFELTARWNNRWHHVVDKQVAERKLCLTKVQASGHRADLYRLEQYRAMQPDLTDPHRDGRRTKSNLIGGNGHPADLTPEQRRELTEFVNNNRDQFNSPGELRQHLITEFGISRNQANGYVNLRYNKS